MKTSDFPALANFLICSLVTISGLYWLRRIAQKSRPELGFYFRAYFCWWLSWVVWTTTWSIIAFTDWEIQYKTLVLGLSDLNAIFLITVYFSLSRGAAYRPITALIDFVGLGLVIAVGYGIFNALIPERFESLQQGWGLCLSAVSTLVVGMAFLKTYQTRAVLLVGFVYAFAQPLAFDAILYQQPTPRVSAILAAFVFVLAIFKVLWATVVTLYFSHEPLCEKDTTSEPLPLFSLPELTKWPWAFYAQTLILVVTVGILLLVAVVGNIPQLDNGTLGLMLTAFGLFLTIVGLLAKMFAYLKKATTREPQN